MDITVLGKGCSRCESIIKRIEREAAELSVLVTISKIKDKIEIDLLPENPSRVM